MIYRPYVVLLDDHTAELVKPFLEETAKMLNSDVAARALFERNGWTTDMFGLGLLIARQIRLFPGSPPRRPARGPGG